MNVNFFFEDIIDRVIEPFFLYPNIDKNGLVRNRKKQSMTDTIIETKKGLKYIKYPIDVFHYYPAI